MLVYADTLSLLGTERREVALRAIGRWLKEQLGYGLRPDRMLEDGEYEGNRPRDNVRTHLRIVGTDLELPRLYSWVVKGADAGVRGRQWITEIGIDDGERELRLSIALRTEELSTLVDEPVSASRPRLVRFLAENVYHSPHAHFSPAVAGVNVKHVGPDQDSYRALRADIERPSRAYAIVLASPDWDGLYLMEPEALQRDLLGLAQVVSIDPAFNSYEMAEVLDTRWSAWMGAVNLLHAPIRSGFVRSELFRADAIERWGAQQPQRRARLLAAVTNTTNLSRLRACINPEGVKQLALRRRLHTARARSAQMDESQLRAELEQASRVADEQAQWNKTVEEENGRLVEELRDVRTQLDESEEARARQGYDIQGLKDQLQAAGAGRTSALDAERLMQIAARGEAPTPLDCLEIIESVYGDRCVILPSARASAAEAAHFLAGRRLLDLTHRLVTEYRDRLLSGGGDSQARKVFGKNEYAAKESQTVTGNKALRRARTFVYRGEEVLMLNHLKIGVDDDPSRTLRLHFHWDSQRALIVIGYCGEHLPVASH